MLYTDQFCRLCHNNIPFLPYDISSSHIDIILSAFNESDKPILQYRCVFSRTGPELS